MRKNLSLLVVFLLLLGGCSTIKSLWGDSEKQTAEASKPQDKSAKAQTASRAPVSATSPQPISPAASNESYKEPTKAQIQLVQQRLKAQGFNPGPADGALGPKTRAALQKYQAARGLASNGMLDAKTMKALGVEY